MDENGQRTSDVANGEMNPEEIFGIHPAEAALMLMNLTPNGFRIAERIAAGDEYSTISKDLGLSELVIRQRLFEVRNELGVADNYAIARIWYAAQFLYLYQEETENGITADSEGRDCD